MFSAIGDWFASRPWGTWGEWFSGLGAITAVAAAFFLQHREHGRQDKLLKEQRKEMHLAEARKMTDRVRKEVRLWALPTDGAIEVSLVNVAQQSVHVGSYEIRRKDTDKVLVPWTYNENSYGRTAHRQIVQRHQISDELPESSEQLSMDIEFYVYEVGWLQTGDELKARYTLFGEY